MKKYAAITMLILLASCNGNDEISDDKPDIPVNAAEVVAPPAPLTFTISNKFPHDTAAFTEGLQIYKGKFYEGTGMENESSLRVADIKTGKVEKIHKYSDPSIFGEGINVFKGKIYQLTWQNHLVYVYDEKDITKPIKTFTWASQGWGMTNDGTYLIISDGSSNIYYVNPEDFSIKRTLSVKDNMGPIDNINELEYIDGFIYANVWQTSDILKINPSNGQVAGKLILAGLPQQYFPKQITGKTELTLNGIAWDSTNKKMYITGKYWPMIFEGTIR
jgi:glutamine cyclotransferase